MGTRRVTRSKAASTDGTGRKAAAGMRRPTSKDHQGAQAADRRVDGGMTARFARHLPLDDEVGADEGEPGSSRRWRKIAVVVPNGSEPDRRGTAGAGCG